MKKTLLLLLLASFAGAASAQLPGVRVGLSATSFGPAVSARVNPLPFISVSAHAAPIELNVLTLSGTYEGNDIDVKAYTSGFGGGLYFRVFPFVRLGAGAILPGYRGEVDSGPLSGTVEVGGETYQSDDVGSILGEVDISGEILPMVSLGLDLGPLEITVGAASAFTPEINLEVTGDIADDPQFQRDLEEFAQQIADDYELPITPFFAVTLNIIRFP